MNFLRFVGGGVALSCISSSLPRSSTSLSVSVSVMAKVDSGLPAAVDMLGQAQVESAEILATNHACADLPSLVEPRLLT